jgi:hypothetical protein
MPLANLLLNLSIRVTVLKTSELKLQILIENNNCVATILETLASATFYIFLGKMASYFTPSTYEQS